ncbi:Rab family GTPase [Limnothrix redekei]|uniref:Rab family GTPase n=1 Tax=Limnothrix redekei LRLZ20PSL1 TaxID=3112953 RepID=A0ABW7C9T8_9CYAN
MQTLSKKICLVGDYAVGKTSLIRRFVDRQFSDRYLSTIGVKISRKIVPVPLPDMSPDRASERTEPMELQLLIWDVEGQTKFQRIAPSYLQGSSGAIVVADATRPDTVSHLRDHANLVRSVSPTSVVILAINKVDLMDESHKHHLQLQVETLLAGVTYSLYWTSAKSGSNVDEIFSELALSMVQPAISRGR